jgi:putative SOS response-associated peptidase YedK
MPVVLPREAYAAWLSAEASVGELDRLVSGAREDFSARPVNASATVPDAGVESAR